MSELRIPNGMKEYILNSNYLIDLDNISNQFNIPYSQLRNYLNTLEFKGLITKVGRDQYLSFQNSKLKPNIGHTIKNINIIIKEISPFLEFIIWSTNNLKEFFHNIPFKIYVFIEAREMYELKSIKEILFGNNFESIIEPKIKDFEDLSFRKETPIFLFRRKKLYGIIELDNIQTIISERCILDLYYYATRMNLNYPLEELKIILTNMIQTREFNFGFLMRYAKIRNIDTEFLIILSKLHEELPNLIPMKYVKRVLKLKNNLEQFFGKEWLNDNF